MPQKLTWTDHDDLHLRRQRALGVAWGDIAASFGINRSTAIAHARRIGATAPPNRINAGFIEAEAAALADPRRDPLPAGHAICWAAITDGTVLEGAPYSLEEAAREAIAA